MFYIVTGRSLCRDARSHATDVTATAAAPFSAAAAVAAARKKRLMEDVRGFEINVLRRFGHVMYGLQQCHPFNGLLFIRTSKENCKSGKPQKRPANFYTKEISICRCDIAEKKGT